ncbi:hypothetical protein GCM10027269_60390 [Kribbella endophytica]
MWWAVRWWEQIERERTLAEELKLCLADAPESKESLRNGFGFGFGFESLAVLTVRFYGKVSCQRCVSSCSSVLQNRGG